MQSRSSSRTSGSGLAAPSMRIRLPSIARRRFWNFVYSSVCRVFTSRSMMSFLNLGYVDPAEPLLGDGIDVADRVSQQLYDRVAGDVDLQDKTVIEVGCGPGAGSAYLARTRRPASFTGLDLNEDMIAWCRTTHQADNLEFRQGDAQSLPIQNGSVDAVVNVESSHCYPSRLRFFGEVARVLRPGGYFLFADIVFKMRRGDEADEVNDQLREAGLIVEESFDITENVLAARNAVSESPLRSRMRESMPRLAVLFGEEALFLIGSRLYRQMESRQLRYLQWKVRKPPSDDSAPASADAAPISTDAAPASDDVAPASAQEG